MTKSANSLIDAVAQSAKRLGGAFSSKTSRILI
nr:MAG TPA: hypothetical protein [Caudoviricetes sp.]